MNNNSFKGKNPVDSYNTEGRSDIMRKLPWSLAFASIPFIPDILELIQSIPDQMAKNGYALHLKHGKTEIHFNKAENVSDSVKGDNNDA